MTGDWWFGVITGVGICLILCRVVDRHRRRGLVRLFDPLSL